MPAAACGWTGARCPTGLTHPLDWWATLQDGSVLRLFTALFLHADWAHLLGNLVFLLIFGLPAERALGPWRFHRCCSWSAARSPTWPRCCRSARPDRVIIGASGAVSALIGAYLALFPRRAAGRGAAAGPVPGIRARARPRC